MAGNVCTILGNLKGRNLSDFSQQGLTWLAAGDLVANGEVGDHVDVVFWVDFRGDGVGKVVTVSWLAASTAMPRGSAASSFAIHCKFS